MFWTQIVPNFNPTEHNDETEGAVKLGAKSPSNCLTSFTSFLTWTSVNKLWLHSIDSPRQLVDVVAERKTTGAYKVSWSCEDAYSGQKVGGTTCEDLFIGETRMTNFVNVKILGGKLTEWNLLVISKFFVWVYFQSSSSYSLTLYTIEVILMHISKADSDSLSGKNSPIELPEACVKRHRKSARRRARGGLNRTYANVEIRPNPRKCHVNSASLTFTSQTYGMIWSKFCRQKCPNGKMRFDSFAIFCARR